MSRRTTNRRSARSFSAPTRWSNTARLAGSHKVSPERPPDRLLTRLAENEDVLVETCDLLTAAVMANRRIAPAGEWLLDNFHLIEEQIRTARRHLPKGYSRELPRLRGAIGGLPRVYDIALETISHGDGRVDPESLSSFVAAYQTVTTLKLGELWAIPIMLRLALIENLRRVEPRIAASTADRDHADHWADQMMEIAEKDPKSLILVIADMARSNPPMASAFVAEFARRLQGQSPALALPLTWIEQRLAESGLTIERLVQSENQTAGRRPGFHRQQHRQPALPGRNGLARVRRDDERRRAEAAGGSWRASTADGFRHARPLPPRRREDRESERPARKRGGAQGIQLAHEGAATDEWRRSSGPRRVLPDRQRVDSQLERTAQARLSLAEALRRPGSRFPLSLYLGAITLAHGNAHGDSRWRWRMPAGWRVGCWCWP